MSNQDMTNPAQEYNKLQMAQDLATKDAEEQNKAKEIVLGKKVPRKLLPEKKRFPKLFSKKLMWQFWLSVSL